MSDRQKCTLATFYLAIVDCCGIREDVLSPEQMSSGHVRVSSMKIEDPAFKSKVTLKTLSDI